MYPRPRYDDALHNMIADLCKTEVSSTQIAADFRVNIQLVQQYRRCLKTFGTCIPEKQTGGRRRRINKAAEERLVQYLEECLQSPTLDEMQTLLLEEFNIDVSISTVSKCLKRLKITYKKGERIHPNRDKHLRSLYHARIAERYSAEQLVVVDESACNESNLDRRWGWSERGTAYRMTNAAASRSKSWSILPAIGINGYLEYEIYQGSFNRERFALFVRKVLKKMNPWPALRSVLVMDNCTTHHSVMIKDLCREAGVLLEYLPPYSPDFSPIEESFSMLKSWIRRNRALAEPFVATGAFELFLHAAVNAIGIKEKAREFFKACHYVVEDDAVDVDYDEL